MENSINIFQFADRDVRITLIDGEPWFVAKDVCEALGLEQVSKALSPLEDDERGLLKVPHPQQPEKLLEVNTVNEPGLYSLILRSRKPEAKVFKHWITHRVLPSIRKTGAYAVKDEKKVGLPGEVSGNALEMLAKALLLAQETISRMSVPVTPDIAPQAVSESPASAPKKRGRPRKQPVTNNAEDLPTWFKRPIGCTLFNKVTGERKQFDSIRSAVRFLGYPSLSITRKQAKAFDWGDWVFTDI